jgi:hypothetical protein
LLVRKKATKRKHPQTLTTRLTILDAEVKVIKSEYGFIEEKIEITFHNQEGIVFSQQLETFEQENSVLEQIITCIGLEQDDEIKIESFIEKSFNAVIATNNDWKKAFIVAAF